MEPPKFVEKPRIVSERDGQLVIMEVKVTAKPKPTVSWIHEGVVVQQSSRIKQTIIEEKGVYIIRMEILNPDVEDSGLYKCNVKNAAGESNANLTLNIEVVPVIRERPRIVRHERKIVIECNIRSVNEPKITWLREQMSVREDSRHQVIVREHRKGEYIVALEIHEPTEKDKGSYKMKAKNEKGEVVSEEISITDVGEEKDESASKKKKVEVKEPKILQGLRSEVS